MTTIKKWLRAIRAPFFTTSIVPVLLGLSIALSEIGHIHWLRGFLAMVGVAACHGGSNLLNDYYDHLSRNDDINKYRSPFNGGSGCIQEGIISPVCMHTVGIWCYALSLACGLILSVMVDFWALAFVLAGIASGLCYSKYPGLSYLGLGELVVGLSFGPLVVSSVYYVQTGFVSVTTIIVSVPIGLLVAAVLYINQFPDFEADRETNRRNLVVRLGRGRALPYYYLLLSSAYLIIVLGVVFRALPLISAVAFLTVPLAGAAAFRAAKWYDKPKEILPANAYTIAAQFWVGLLLTAAFTWNALM